jgi:hypothetical protein
MAKAWTELEVATLAEIAARHLPLSSQMHRLPGRTPNAARMHGSRLKIRFSDELEWSDEERAILRRIYAGDKPIKFAVRAELCGRTYRAALSEAIRLGIAGEKSRRPRVGYGWVGAAIDRLLAKRTMTCEELAAGTGASLASIRKIFQTRPPHKYYVADWIRIGGARGWTPVWGAGDFPDAPRPPRKSARDACRDYRSRRRIRAGRVDPFASLALQVAA